MKDLLKDLTYGWRSLWKHRLLTGAALISLALGIGANVAIFTLVNAFFLRPLPVEAPEDLVAVYGALHRDGKPSSRYFPISHMDYMDFQGADSAFSGLTAYQSLGLSLAIPGGEVHRLRAAAVAGNYFDVLGVPMAVGRGFRPDEDETWGSHPVVVLSHALWERLYGGDEGIVGQKIILNRREFTVVGVSQQGFIGTNRASETDAWVPLAMYTSVARAEYASLLSKRDGRLLYLIGRLKDNADFEGAKAAMDTQAAQLSEAFPKSHGNWGLHLLPLTEVHTRPEGRDVQKKARLLLSGAVGLVLLISCVNVANLLLARAVGRRREVAIRVSLGAGKWRLLRQLLVESMLLAGLGGLLGLALAHWGVRFLWKIKPPFFTENALDLSLDPTILLFALVLSLGTGLLFGLFPAIQLLRRDLVTPLKDQAPGADNTRRPFLLRNLTIILQLGLCLICLMGGGLFIKNLRQIQNIDPGFNTEQLLLASVDLSREGYDEARGRQVAQGILERLEGVSGLAAHGLGEIRILTGAEFRSHIDFEGQELAQDGERALIRTNYTSPGYLDTLDIPILKGRGFNQDDRVGSRQVAIVNETMARLHWPDLADPVGRRIRLDAEEEYVEVIGVAGDAKYAAVREAPQPYIYLPFLQRYSAGWTLYLRTEPGLEPGVLISELRQAVRDVDSGILLTGVSTGREVIRGTLWAESMAAGLLSFFGVLALILAVVGIYGVMAYAVVRRQAEICMRMAMGAGRLAIVSLILREALIVVLIGIAVGFTGGVLGLKGLGSLLYDLEISDPGTLATVALILGLTTLLASLIPAVRAMHMNPVSVLRAD